MYQPRQAVTGTDAGGLRFAIRGEPFRVFRPKPDKPGPGQESVWDYPRPPRLEPTDKRVRGMIGATVLFDTQRALRLLETSHPPSYYIPPEAFAEGWLVRNDHSSICEWKGRARYFDLKRPDGTVLENVVWDYPQPVPSFATIKDHVSIYCWALDEAYVGEHRATPQEGQFYGGWITPDVVGPFKGGPGSWGW